MLPGPRVPFPILRPPERKECPVCRAHLHSYRATRPVSGPTTIASLAIQFITIGFMHVHVPASNLVHKLQHAHVAPKHAVHIMYLAWCSQAAAQYCQCHWQYTNILLGHAIGGNTAAAGGAAAADANMSDNT